MGDRMKKKQAFWLFEGGFMYSYELRNNMGKRIAMILPNPLPMQCYEGHKIHLYSPGKKVPIKTINRKELGVEEAKNLAEVFAKKSGYQVSDKREIDLDEYAELVEGLQDKIIFNRSEGFKLKMEELEEKVYAKLIQTVSQDRLAEDLRQNAINRLNRILQIRSKSKDRRLKF